MGQLFIIKGTDPAITKALFRRGIDILSRISGAEISDELVLNTLCIGKVECLRSTTTGILREPASRRWCCWVGTPFFSDPGSGGATQWLASNGHRTHSGRNSLEGTFGIAAGDPDGSFLVITDRLGSLHLYRTHVNGCLIMSTSACTLAALTDAEWDVESCREFLCTGTVFSDRSLFKGIDKLQPATVYYVDPQGAQTSTSYWSVAEAVGGAGATGSVTDLGDTLVETLSRITREYNNPVVDVTGGFDSRAVLAAMIRTGAPFECVVNGPAGSPDVLTSQLIARTLGLRHRHQLTRIEKGPDLYELAQKSVSLCDGEYNVLLYASTLNAHLRLSSDFDISINGSNGELCKGYWWELLFPFTGRRGHFVPRKVAAKRFAVDLGFADSLAAPCKDDLVDHFATIISRANEPLADAPNTAKMDNVYLMLRMQRWQGRIASATSRIWPCTSPFMWRQPMEIALSMPPRERKRNRGSRELIHYLNPVLAKLPLAGGYPAVPIRLDTAHLFGPMVVDLTRRAARKIHRSVLSKARWKPSLRKANGWLPLSADFRNLFDPSRMLTRPLYKEDFLNTVLSSAQHEHLGRLITLELLAILVKRNTGTSLHIS